MKSSELLMILFIIAYGIAVWYPLKSFTFSDERTRQSYMIGGVVWTIIGALLELMWYIAYTGGI